MIENPIKRSKEMDNLFLAIFFCDLEKVKEIKSKFPNVYKNKENYPIDEFLTLKWFNNI